MNTEPTTFPDAVRPASMLKEAQLNFHRANLVIAIEELHRAARDLGGSRVAIDESIRALVERKLHALLNP